MSITDLIAPFLELCFTSQRSQFSKEKVAIYEQLLTAGVLVEIGPDNRYVELDNNSTVFNQALLERAENRLGCMLPQEVGGAMKFVDEFEECLKKDYKHSAFNAFSYFIRGLNGYCLVVLEKVYQVDILAFTLSLGEEDEREGHLFAFEDSFFRYLPFSAYSAKAILEVCLRLSEEESHQWRVISFLRELPKRDITKARALIATGHENNMPSKLLRELLIGLYNTGEADALERIFLLEQTNRLDFLVALGRLNYKAEDIKAVFDRVGPLEYAQEDIAGQQSYCIAQLVKCPYTPVEKIEPCFLLWASFITNGTHPIQNAVMGDAQLLQGHDGLKYKLLRLYLDRTGNFGIVKRYFNNFKEPGYIFDLIISCYEATPGIRFPAGYFTNGIRHGWRADPLRSELLVLELFTAQPEFGILAVKILFMRYGGGVFEVDLLKLEKPESQLNAITAFCRQPYSFDRLLSMLLALRHSPFEEVRGALQARLADMVYASYHETLYHSIEKLLDVAVSDKEFFNPVKQAMANYRKLKALKNSIGDLSPYENEGDLIALYYRLEDEEKAKMMRRADSEPGPFSGVRNVDIVRGNSSKFGDNDPVALTRVGGSIMIDGASSLNPDSYEHNLNNLQ